jgi:PAS domain S-box-containing protein
MPAFSDAVRDGPDAADSADDARAVRAQALRLSALVALLYGAFGLAWIVASDALVLAVSRDVQWLALAQRYKGISYILVTAALLMGGMYRIGLYLVESRERLAERDLRIQDLFEHHPTPMWVYDRTSLAVLAVNDAAVAQYGYTRPEFLGMTLRELRPPEEVPRLEREQAARTPAGYGDAGIWRHLTKSGEVLHVHITVHAIDYRDRGADLVLARNVTGEVASADALRRQEALFRQLHDSVDDTLWLATPDGRRMLYVSPSFERIYGRPADELLADPALWLKVVAVEDRERVVHANKGLASSTQVELEYRILRPDGGVRWVLDRRRQIRDAEGHVVMVGGILQDVTARRRASEALRESNALLEERVAARTGELAVANAGLEWFARAAAHDLKSPLRGIAGLAALVKRRCEGAGDRESVRLLDYVDKSADAMTRLIDDIMALSRSGVVELRRENVDVSAVSAEVFDELHTLYPERHVEVHVAPDLSASADPGLVRSLLQNLIGNAWKYSGKQPHARIDVNGAVDAAGDFVFAVQDNGIGFSQALAEQLFEPFRRLHGDAEFEGTGLGLATCKRIVERHGGRIWATSEPGVGTTFSFTLA